jgi:hypothetical protein
MNTLLLQPACALVVWTLIIWVWMYATRLPAIFKARVNFDKVKNGAQLRPLLPERVSWVADNYNHLLEQPVIFYALCFVLILSGSQNESSLILAWSYVALRITHSLWQCLINHVTTRFFIFSISTFVLMALALQSAKVFFIN